MKSEQYIMIKPPPVLEALEFLPTGEALIVLDMNEPEANVLGKYSFGVYIFATGTLLAHGRCRSTEEARTEATDTLKQWYAKQNK